MKKVMVVLAMVIMIGCSQHHMAAQIGPHEIHVVQSWHVIAPSSTETFSYDTRNQDLSQVNNGIGGGVLSIAAMPIATVTAAHELSEGISRSGDNISTTNTTSSLSEGSSAEGGTANGGDSIALGGDAESRASAGASAQSQSYSVSSSTSQNNNRIDSKNTLTNTNQNANLNHNQVNNHIEKPKPNNGHGKK